MYIEHSSTCYKVKKSLLLEDECHKICITWNVRYVNQKLNAQFKKKKITAYSCQREVRLHFMSLTL